MASRNEQPNLRSFTAWFLILLAAGCATSSPFTDIVRRRVDPELSPARVLLDYPRTEGREVLWGGRILGSRNLVGSTEFTVLAYPIDAAGMPQTDDHASLGRFIMVHTGYLETVDYAPGREITVYGRIAGTREVVLGATSDIEPVVAAMQIHLWRQTPPWEGPWFHFGIGISGGF